MTHDADIVQAGDLGRIQRRPPTQPELTPHLAVWRAPDGWATFHRKHPETGEHQDLFSLPVERLQGWFPALRQWLLRDAYASVNLMYRGAPYPSKTDARLPAPWRGHDRLRYLCAGYVDIDVGRPTDPDPLKRATPGMALGVIADLSREGVIPRPSLLAESGRGVYAVWLLRDESGDGPHRMSARYHDRDLALYKAVNKAAQARIRSRAAIYVDHAHDAARILRFHGSVHTGAGRRTEYWLAADAQGRGYMYTLRQLADFYGLDPQPDLLGPGDAPALDAAPKDAARAAAGRKGARTARRRKAQHYLREALLIEQHQGGFAKPRRARALAYVARWMVDAQDYDRQRIQDALTGLGLRCRPPYPDEPADERDDSIHDIVTRAINGHDGLARKRIKTAVLAQFFGVDYDTAVDLALRYIVPPARRAEIKAQPAPRDAARIERHQWIIDRLQAYPQDAQLPIREWHERLNAAGHPCGARTVATDLRVLEQLGHLHKGRGGPGRPRRT